MKNLFLVLFATLLLVSCSNPLNKKYNKETLANDMKEIKESKKLSDEDLNLLTTSLFQKILKSEDSDGKTYKDLLNEAKKYKQEQDELKLEEEQKAAQHDKQMQDAIVITMTGKDFVDGTYSSYNGFKYAVKNKTDKEIDALKFHFIIKDKLGDDIGNGYQVSLTSDKIHANETYSGNAGFDYNQFMDDDIKIKNAKFEDLTFNITVDKIVYTDGSTLE